MYMVWSKMVLRRYTMSEPLDRKNFLRCLYTCLSFYFSYIDAIVLDVKTMYSIKLFTLSSDVKIAFLRPLLTDPVNGDTTTHAAGVRM